MKKIRAFGRLLCFVLLALAMIVETIAFNWLKGRPDEGLRARRRFVRRFLPVLGVQMTTAGVLPQKPCIIMSNHRSYLDPALLSRDLLLMPVSKAEVARWPLIGYAIRLTGVLFLKRESADSRRRVLTGIAEKVKEGRTVLLFPEGTTHASPTTHALRRGGFELAAQYGVPIVPVALDYADPADYWINDDDFLSHFIRRFGEKRTRVMVRYGQPIMSGEADTLLNETQRWIDREMTEIQQALRGETLATF